MSGDASRGELEASSERVALATVLAHPLLRELEPRVRADVRAAFRVRRFADGALVFAAGDPAESVFVVGAGAIDAISDRREQRQRAARRVRAGELLGEEALAPGARRSQAVAVGACVLVEIPVPVLRRAAERSFGTRLHREERRARRAAFRALLAGSPLGHGVPEAVFEALFAEAAEERHARGSRIVFSGERACLIVDGLFRVDSGAKEAGFRGRGDTLGLVEALADEAFEAAVEVISDGLVLQFPKKALRALSLSAPRALEGALTQERAARERQRRVLRVEPVRETRVALSELGRLTSAGSLLAIELDRCARCGHCAKACADTHGDARVLRQGEKVIATLANEGMPRQTALLFPVACQHCREPACLSACPTGAIVRDASAVLVREELCTGCGACATACPWDAVRMRERPAAGELAGAGSALVASKCDLCHGRDASACVDACPTGAIVRLTPERDVLELGALSIGREKSARQRLPDGAGRTSPSPVAWIARVAPIPPLVALLSFGMERAGPRLRLAAGFAAAVLAVLLAAQSWLKRSAWARSRVARLVPRDRYGSLVRPMLALHGWVGALSVGGALLHGGLSVPSSGAAGVLWLSFFGCAASGALGAVAYRLLPRRITRLERSAFLPEDAPREVERLLDGLFVATTGQNPAIKQLLASVLMPYVRSRAGVFELLISGRGLSEENARLGARIERALSGRVSQRLASHRPLVATAVALRAERAKRVLEHVLAAFVPVHLALCVVMLVMLAIHVAGALT
jgi:Fe-S-cluster-containing hydrogenase component 2/CRP-like cAMP-binding protein